MLGRRGGRPACREPIFEGIPSSGASNGKYRCAGTTGPGSNHLVAGLYEAARDHAPVLALSGDMTVAERVEGVLRARLKAEFN